MTANTKKKATAASTRNAASKSNKGKSSVSASTAKKSSKAAQSPKSQEVSKRAGSKAASGSRSASGTKAAAKTKAAYNPSEESISSGASVQKTNPGILREAFLWLILAVCIFIFISYFGVGGYVGEVVSDVCFGIFGVVAYILPFFIFMSCAFLISNKGNRAAGLKIFSAACLCLCICSFVSLLTFKEAEKSFAVMYDQNAVHRTGGGLLGDAICGWLCPALGEAGTGVVLLILSIVFLVLITQKSLMRSMKKQGSKVYQNAKSTSARRRKERLEELEQASEHDSASARRDPAGYAGRREKKRRGQTVVTYPSESGYPVRREIDVPVTFPVQSRSERKKHKVSGVTLDTKIQGNPGQVGGEVHQILPGISQEMSRQDQEPAETTFINLDGIVQKNRAGQERQADAENNQPSELEIYHDAPDLHIEGLDTGKITGTENEPKEEHISRTQGSLNEDQAFAVPGGSNAGRASGGKSSLNAGRVSGEQSSLNPGRASGGRSSLNAGHASAAPDGSNPGRASGGKSSLNVERASAAPDSSNPGRASGGKSSLNVERASAVPDSSNPDRASRGQSGPDTGREFNSRRIAQAEWENEPQDDFASMLWRDEGSQEAGSTSGTTFSVPSAGKKASAGNSRNAEPPEGAGNTDNAENTQHAARRNPRSSQQEIQAGIASVEAEAAKAAETVRPQYVYPPLELLKKGKGKSGANQEQEVRRTAAKLQQTLESFNVHATVTNVSCGPAVTRYELQPEQGVKVSRIVGLSDDIKLNLAAADIRIEAPIPGKAAVGIEVPNSENSTVALRDLIESPEFQRHSSKLAFATGKDISGKVVVSDIAKMPHLLIAGATGSGKSVCINTLIMSILYKASPEEVKLIMIDPKVVELSVYNGIPHLFIPVVTDPKKAAGALNWGVAEMTDRYNKFAEYGVRDIKGYNKKIEALDQVEDENKPRKLPQIVIIVDELADLMMVAPGEVEDSICRLAQLARAAGIHLVIATQRPSVNVITGLIKANMPSRIAFSVSSSVDSRTILDMGGAEKLLGKGDMLFYPQGYQKPARVQGAFVSDEEVADVVDFLKAKNTDETYSADIEAQIEKVQSAVAASHGEADVDALFADAGKFIIEKDKASIGMLQRVFKIGFNRAARIMDQLSDAGVVGPEEGTKPRKVLMSPEEFENYLEQH